jgi:hypothetical protein
MYANGEQQHDDLEENIYRISMAEHSVLPSILTRPKPKHALSPASGNQSAREQSIRRMIHFHSHSPALGIVRQQ